MQQVRQLPPCTGFANAQTRQEHFTRHPNSLENAIAYEREGIDFMNRARDSFNQGEHVEGLYLSVRASNGDFTATYWMPDESLGLFGTMTSNGVLRTFFGITSAKDFTKVFKS